MDAQENGMAEIEGQGLPRRITVSELISSRYGDAGRPSSWDKRVAGIDKIRSEQGVEILLQSDGQQSAPQAGWVILLTDGSDTDGYQWTLYGMPKV